MKKHTEAFTLVEIAICLAIIGVALVGIIGVLPIGLNTQRDTREETIINQDVQMLLPMIAQGARGSDDLTNYVYAVTNYWGQYDANGNLTTLTPNGYQNFLTNGLNIIGVLSTPEYADANGNPIPSLSFGGVSNHILAYVRSISGLAAEKPPQNNEILVSDSFSYRVLCVNAPPAMGTNIFYQFPSWKAQAYAQGDEVFHDWNYWQAVQNNIGANEPGFSGWAKVPYYPLELAANQHELRMSFYWPLLPSGNVGNGRQTFRQTVAGSLEMVTNNGTLLYFLQAGSFRSN